MSAEDQQSGRYWAVSTLDLPEGEIRLIWLEDVSSPLLLTKQVFINEDGSRGTLYLVTGDLTLTYDRMTSLYQKRFRVEGYHKSLKQNARLEKSPTRTETTQQNHFFTSVCLSQVGEIEDEARGQPFCLEVKDLYVGFEGTCQARTAVSNCVTSEGNMATAFWTLKGARDDSYYD